MRVSDLAKLAAGFAAGSITAEAIESEHGHDILGAVMGLAGGAVTGVMVSEVMDATGISDLLDELL